MITTIDDANLSAIGNAIREKNGEETTYKPSEMADAILALVGGGDDVIVTIGEITEKWFNSTATVDGEFWEICPNGFDDVIAIMIGTTSSSGYTSPVFPQMDAAYVITIDNLYAISGSTIIEGNYALYPERFKAFYQSYGWNYYFPFNGGNGSSTGHYFAIDKDTKTTIGAYTQNKGSLYRAMAMDVVGNPYLVIRKVQQ